MILSIISWSGCTSSARGVLFHCAQVTSQPCLHSQKVWPVSFTFSLQGTFLERGQDDVVAGTEDAPVVIAPATLLANDSAVDGHTLALLGPRNPRGICGNRAFEGRCSREQRDLELNAQAIPGGGQRHEARGRAAQNAESLQERV